MGPPRKRATAGYDSGGTLEKSAGWLDDPNLTEARRRVLAGEWLLLHALAGDGARDEVEQALVLLGQAERCLELAGVRP